MPLSSKHGSSLASSVTPSRSWPSTTHTCISSATTLAPGTALFPFIFCSGECRFHHKSRFGLFLAMLFYSSRLEPVSTQSTPQGSGAATPDNHSTIDTLSEQDEGTLTPSSKQTTPTTSPNSFIRYYSTNTYTDLAVYCLHTASFKYLGSLRLLFIYFMKSDSKDILELL